MPRLKFDDVIPSTRYYASKKELLEKEAASRLNGADLADIIRDAMTEYIANHKLEEKFNSKSKSSKKG
jgi:hypothetical protein